MQVMGFVRLRCPADHRRFAELPCFGGLNPTDQMALCHDRTSPKPFFYDWTIVQRVLRECDEGHTRYSFLNFFAWRFEPFLTGKIGSTTDESRTISWPLPSGSRRSACGKA